MAATDRAQCVFISGRSGEGKTSLAEHFFESLNEVGDSVVLGGRCYDRESVPFKALDGIIDTHREVITYWEESEVNRMHLPDQLHIIE